MENLRERVDLAVEKGVLWLKARQKANGGYGQWGAGSTGLAVMALLACGLPTSAPAVAGAAAHILDCRPADSTHFRALTVMALLAYGSQTPDVSRRVQSDTEWLIGAQNADPADLSSYGGWGHDRGTKGTDGANTQFALMALREAAARGSAVPPETWRRALAWYRENHAVNKDGSFVYSPGKHSPGRGAAILHATTAGAWCGLLAISLFSPDREVRSQARNLAGGALDWLGAHYSDTAAPGSPAPNGWDYHFLFSLGQGGAVEPDPAVAGGCDWGDEAAKFLVGCQEPDGRWLGAGEKKSTEVIYTSLALLTLAGVALEYRKKRAGGNDAGHKGLSDTVGRSAAAIGEWETDPGADDAGDNGRRGDLGSKDFGRRRVSRVPALLFVLVMLVCGTAGLWWISKKDGPGVSVHQGNEPAVPAGGEGVVAPASSGLISKVSGFVAVIEVEPGGWVSEGQAVLRIDPGGVESALLRTKSEIDACLARIDLLSQKTESEFTSESDGVITRLHVEPGPEVSADTVVATLLSDRLLDVTLAPGGTEFQFLNEGLSVDLYLPGRGRVEAVLISPVQIERAGEGGAKFRVRIEREHGGGLPGDNEAEMKETDGRGDTPEASEPLIVFQTVLGPLETACEVAGVELAVRPGQDGRLAALYVTEGDTVAADQPLGRVESKAALGDLKAQRIELSRLHEAKRHLQERLHDYTVVSPVSGKVVALFVEKGAPVRPGALVAYIEDPDRYQVSVLLKGWILPISHLRGSPALVTVGGEELNGTVDRVVEGAGEDRSLLVVVIFDRKPGLETGLPARVRVLP